MNKNNTSSMNELINILYNNIGQKIRYLAFWGFVVEAISSVVGGIVMLIDQNAVGIVLLIAGPIVAWVSSWLLYAFGQLVENVADMNEAQATATARAKQPVAPKAATQATPKATPAAQPAPVAAVKAPPAAIAAHHEEPKAAEEAPKTPGQSRREKLAYALRYTTDEGMINYLKTMDDPVVNQIINGPIKQIRSRILEESQKQ